MTIMESLEFLNPTSRDLEFNPGIVITSGY